MKNIKINLATSETQLLLRFVKNCDSKFEYVLLKALFTGGIRNHILFYNGCVEDLCHKHQITLGMFVLKILKLPLNIHIKWVRFLKECGMADNMKIPEKSKNFNDDIDYIIQMFLQHFSNETQEIMLANSLLDTIPNHNVRKYLNFKKIKLKQLITSLYLAKTNDVITTNADYMNLSYLWIQFLEINKFDEHYK